MFCNPVVLVLRHEVTAMYNFREDMDIFEENWILWPTIRAIISKVSTKLATPLRCHSRILNSRLDLKKIQSIWSLLQKYHWTLKKTHSFVVLIRKQQVFHLFHPKVELHGNLFTLEEIVNPKYRETQHFYKNRYWEQNYSEINQSNYDV